MPIDRNPAAIRRRAQQGTQDGIDLYLLAMAGEIEWIEDDAAPDGGAWAWTSRPPAATPSASHVTDGQAQG